MRPALLAICSLLLLAACSGSRTGGSDAGNLDAGPPDAGGSDAGTLDAGVDAGPVDAGFPVGPHAAFPAVPDNGGPVLTHPRLVTVGFAIDPHLAAREQFVDWVVDSGWYGAWTPDYGVGPASVIAHVELPDHPTGQLSQTQIGSILADLISDGGVPSPLLADGGRDDVLYAFFFTPSTTEIFEGATSCGQFGTEIIGGFHWESTYQGTPFPFAVVPTCQFGTTVESDAQVEYSASHELAEAITDPFPQSAPAYGFPFGSAWAYTDGEVGDLCEGPIITEDGHSLTRVWSNSSIAEGGSPCIPQPDDPFFAVSASTDTVTVDAGDSVQLEVDGWSTGARDDWSVATLAYPNGRFGITPSASLSASTVNNGQSVTLTITVPANASSGASGYVAVSAYTTTNDFIDWPVLVQVR